MLRENEENIYTNGNGEKLLGFANLNSNQCYICQMVILYFLK